MQLCEKESRVMKRNYWPLLFIGIFSFTFGMIVWTIMSAVKLPVHEDKSFLKTYQDVDSNFNTMMTSNKVFKSKYNLEFILNNKKLNLTTSDIKFSQRVLEKKSLHKNLLKNGFNNLSINVFDKKTLKKLKVKIDLNVTKSILNDSDIRLKDENFSNNLNEYSTKFEINDENNWNITGTFTIGNDIGYIYIKTNAI